MKRFTIAYRFEECSWSLDLMAEDYADAVARLNALKRTSYVMGHTVAAIPAVVPRGWVDRLCDALNRIHRGLV